MLSIIILFVSPRRLIPGPRGGRVDEGSWDFTGKRLLSPRFKWFNGEFDEIWVRRVNFSIFHSED
jgi:hypothetical protein